MAVIIKIWRAAPLAMLMTALAVLAEAVSNGLRAYGLGEHLSHFTVPTPWGFKVSLAGVVLVAGAAAISVYQAKFATILLTGKVTAQRWISAPFLVMCLLISGASMVSHVRDAQRAKGSGETTTRGDYDRVERGYLLLFGELNDLQKQTIRTVDVINADIRALDIPMKFWRRSKQCMDITEEDTKKACAQALTLYKERGNAARKAELEGEVKAARQKLETTERPAELSWLDEFVAFLWPWLFGVGIVSVATFGYAVATMQAKAPVSVSLGTKNAGFPVETEAQPRKPNGGNRLRRMTKRETESFVVTQLALGKSLPSQDWLAAKTGVGKGTISKWMTEWEDRGLVTRARAGKCKMIEAA